MHLMTSHAVRGLRVHLISPNAVRGPRVPLWFYGNKTSSSSLEPREDGDSITRHCLTINAEKLTYIMVDIAFQPALCPCADVTSG